MYAADATKKKDSTAESFRTSSTFSQSLTMLVGKSKSVYNRFDNYLSQVKINVKLLTTAILKISGEFFVFQQDSAQAHSA